MMIQRQPWRFAPVGAWSASWRHSRMMSLETGFSKSSRFLTARVVESRASVIERSYTGMVSSENASLGIQKGGGKRRQHVVTRLAANTAPYAALIVSSRRHSL